jgi:hypothetical protein
VLQSAQKAGGLSRGGSRGGGRFGRGRAAGLVASRLLQNRGRNVMIKARVAPGSRNPSQLLPWLGRRNWEAGTSPFIRFGIQFYHAFPKPFCFGNADCIMWGMITLFIGGCTKLRQRGA